MFMTILLMILQAVYLMIPAYFANMAPIFVKKIPFLNYPVDFGKKLKGIRIFGAHKTWRGLLFGTLAGIIMAYIQSVLYNVGFFNSISLLNYSNWLLFGLLMGSGAVIGDSVKSFFKRRVGVKPGERFIFWDQLDYIFGALLFIWIIFDLTIKVVITVIVVSFFLPVIVNHIAYYLGIRDVKW